MVPPAEEVMVSLPSLPSCCPNWLFSVVYVLFRYKLFRYKFRLVDGAAHPENWRTLSHWKKGASIVSKVGANTR